MQACREVYRDKCHDFAKLAELQPSLASHLVWLPPRDESASPSSAGARRATIDFAREESVEELTRCILRQDFGISWERPPRSLIPPVPNRLTYLLWLRDLVLSTKPSDGEGGVRGVDVGTGGTLIYPLLGASAFGWTFLATESCEYSLGWAERNRASNAGVKDLITVRDSKGGVLLGVVDEGARYDFCMCNPPFFDVTEERSLHKPGGGGGVRGEDDQRLLGHEGPSAVVHHDDRQEEDLEGSASEAQGGEGRQGHSHHDLRVRQNHPVGAGVDAHFG